MIRMSGHKNVIIIEMKEVKPEKSLFYIMNSVLVIIWNINWSFICSSFLLEGKNCFLINLVVSFITSFFAIRLSTTYSFIKEKENKNETPEKSFLQTLERLNIQCNQWAFIIQNPYFVQNRKRRWRSTITINKILLTLSLLFGNVLSLKDKNWYKLLNWFGY